MKKNIPYLLFIAGIVFTFTFITLLQFVSPKENIFLFVGTLVLMHVGIVCFIFSKKAFKKLYDGSLPADIKKCFSREYYFLLWYLPVLAAKLFLPLLFDSITFNSGTPEYSIKLGAVITMSAIFVAESVFTAIKMQKILLSPA